MATWTSEFSYIDAGTVKHEPSIFSHFAKTLESSATNIAIKVVHQRPNYLDELRGTFESRSQPGNDEKSLTSVCLSWTYEQLHYAALQVVRSLQLQGVTTGSALVCLVPNGIEWAIVLWASVLGKFSLCCLDSGALSAPRADELQTMLQKIKPDVAFVSTEDDANAIDKAFQSQSLTPRVKVMLRPSRRNQHQLIVVEYAATWTTLLDMAIPSMPQSMIRSIEEDALLDDHNRMALMLFTSGTTLGTPKGCPHTVLETLHCMNQNWDKTSPMHPRRLVQTANFRIIAPTLAMSTWAEGGAIILPSAAYNPQAMLTALRDKNFAINFALFIPAQLHAIIAQEDFATASEQIAIRGDLKVINLGGDIITEDLFNKARKAFPNTNVRAGHGMTEGGAAFTWPEGIDSPPFHRGIAPVGKTNAGTRLKIAATDNEHGSGQQQWRPLRRGAVGELQFWNEALICGYLDGINSSDFYTDEHRQTWFHTGDIGLIDDEGWVYLLSRKKDIIKRAGVPITPAAIETCLDTYLNSHTSVVGVPHSTLGQEPVAIVRNLGQTTKEDVKDHVLAKFGRDYGLGNVFALHELGLDEFPLNATGKIMKWVLLERIASLA